MFRRLPRCTNPLGKATETLTLETDDDEIRGPRMIKRKKTFSDVEDDSPLLKSVKTTKKSVQGVTSLSAEVHHHQDLCLKV